MATDETTRYRWPIPAWNADWQKWQEIFKDLTGNIDATTFATMSNAHLTMKQLPNVEVKDLGGGNWVLEMSGDAIFISRTHLTEIRLAQETVALTANSLLALTFTPGAVGPQNIGWEVYEQGVDVAPEVIPVGYVDGSYNIIWYNGAKLAAGGGLQGLFGFSGGSGSGDKVRVSAADTLENFLISKIAAGTNVSLATLNPGGNEQLEINVSASSVPTGKGNVYIDDLNGSDATGDGSIGNPYKTLSNAAATVVAPANFPAFQEDVTFVLAPGIYSNVVTMPRRQNVSIVGNRAVLSGDINWFLDGMYWFGNDPAVHVATLRISDPNNNSEISGNITVKNDNAAAGAVSTKTLYLQNLQLLGHLINDETGDAAVASGTLVLMLNNVTSDKVAATRRLGGRKESGGAAGMNLIQLSAQDCDLTGHTICGCTRIVRTDNTRLRNASYLVDPTGGGAYQGVIEGDIGVSFDGMTSTLWLWLYPSAFGSTVVIPQAFAGDAYTMRWLLEGFAVGLYSFSSFVVDPNLPYDWWWMTDHAAGVEVDDSSFTGALTGKRSVQECLATLDVSGGVTDATTIVNAVNHTLSATEIILSVTYTLTGICTVMIPTSEINKGGRSFDVVDAGGNSAQYYILIQTEGGQTINGESDAKVNLNGASLTLYSDGSNLFVR